ncbi:MAG: hypothetical protein HKO59_04160, partial [Phycisphaerales bacterium]|nr:hypothetical protein [Phycisphaerales bacterium]
MHCKSCNYALWNLAAGVCPECGTPFRPSDYDFVPNAVRFCCPHCDQSYYGTGERGHLVPESFECVSCGTMVAMDEMVLRPTEGVEPEATQADRMPWFEREHRGTVRAWLATVTAAMNRPSSLMRAVPPDVTSGQAWLFMYVTNVIFSIAGMILPGMLVAVLLAAAPSTFGGAALGRSVMMQALIVQAALLMLMALLPAIWAWGTHLLVGVGFPERAPMRRTFHAICYSVGPNCLTIVPFDCVRMAGRIWWAVAAILMLKQAHRCSGARATFAVLGSGLVVLIIGLAVIGAAVFATIRPALQSARLSMATGETQTMTQAIIDYAADHAGEGPVHALQLVTAQDLATGNFVSLDSDTDETQVPVADTTLAELALLSSNQRVVAIDAAREALPESTIAHRVGDFVFTYHGLDLSACDAGLWVLVLWPDP